MEESSLPDSPLILQNSSVTINGILSWTKMRPQNALHSQFGMLYYLTSKEKIQRLFYLPSKCTKPKESFSPLAKLSDVEGSWADGCVLRPRLTFSRLLNNVDPSHWSDLLQSRSGFLMCHVHYCWKFMAELNVRRKEKNKHIGSF